MKKEVSGRHTKEQRLSPKPFIERLVAWVNLSNISETEKENRVEAKNRILDVL